MAGDLVYYWADWTAESWDEMMADMRAFRLVV